MLAAAVAVLHIALSPAHAAPDGLFRVDVSGLPAPAASVVVHGGIASRGKMFGLVPLRDLGHGSWTTVLRAPGFFGAYPVRVRARGVYHEASAVVSVLPKGFASAPGGPTPRDVVERWRELSPGGVTIAGASIWKRGFYYHRDQRYNALLRVKFTLIEAWPRYHVAAGTFVRWFNVVRTSQTSSWRLAEIVAAP
jgi:hypothetical protein